MVSVADSLAAAVGIDSSDACSLSEASVEGGMIVVCAGKSLACLLEACSDGGSSVDGSRVRNSSADAPEEPAREAKSSLGRAGRRLSVAFAGGNCFPKYVLGGYLSKNLSSRGCKDLALSMFSGEIVASMALKRGRDLRNADAIGGCGSRV